MGWCCVRWNWPNSVRCTALCLRKQDSTRFDHRRSR